MGLTVLLVFVNNPNSISFGAGDPRFFAMLGIGNELHKRGHTVLWEGAGGLSSTKTGFFLSRGGGILKHSNFTRIDKAAVDKHGRPDLMVCWFNYLKDSNTRQKKVVSDLLVDPTIPHLLYENGMTKGSITIDPKGLLGSSFYVDSLNERVQRGYDEAGCSAHIRRHLVQDSSKRPQAQKVDIPASIHSRYVFIPTQKFADVSVVRYSNITYPQLLQNATLFCKAHDLPLVIKIHPHLVGQERMEQKTLIEELQKQHSTVYASAASINFLTSNALFTVTLNGGTLMDNFYTTTPVLTLAHGFFHRTDAVVSEQHVMHGMRRMLRAELPWREERKLRQRQIVCWYDRMALKANNTGAQNIDVIQAHVDALALPSHPQF